jgi:MFS family permease
MRADTRLVVFVCAAEILGLAGFSLVPALLPQFIATWSLSNIEAGWLAGIMSGGYMVGVLPLVALTDRVPARTIFLVCGALNALASFGISLSNGLLPALVWRGVGGIALAGMFFRSAGIIRCRPAIPATPYRPLMTCTLSPFNTTELVQSTDQRAQAVAASFAPSSLVIRSRMMNF